MGFRRAIRLGIALAFGVGVTGIALVWWTQTQTYTVEGRVAGVEDDGRTLYVEHEEIPGYMPAMVMPLPVRDPAEAVALEEDAAIRFQLTVTGDSAWIDALETIADTAVARHPARSVRPMPGAQDAGEKRLREGDSVPADLSLTNQAGTSIQLGDFREKVLVLTFIYTRCPLPTYCPLMSKHFTTLQPKLRAQFGTRTHLLSVSFDLSYDTPAILREYAAKYTDRFDTWTFATGDSTEIEQITSRFGVFTRKEDGEIIHNLTTAVIGPDGTVHRIFRGNDWAPEDVLGAVRQVMEQARTKAHGGR